MQKNGQKVFFPSAGPKGARGVPTPPPPGSPTLERSLPLGGIDGVRRSGAIYNRPRGADGQIRWHLPERRVFHLDNLWSDARVRGSLEDPEGGGPALTFLKTGWLKFGVAGPPGCWGGTKKIWRCNVFTAHVVLGKKS